MSDFMVSLPKLAAQMEVDESALLRLVRDGDIPAPAIIGGAVRFDPLRLAQWRADGCPKGEPCGHRVLNAVRRALLDESDEHNAVQMARLSKLLDNATPEMLRAARVYL